MANHGEKLTEARTIVITVREGDFDVAFNGLFSVEEVYNVFVACQQHIEENIEDIVDDSASSMVH